MGNIKKINKKNEGDETDIIDLKDRIISDRV